MGILELLRSATFNGHTSLTAAFTIQSVTGCRSCELLSLKWQDVTNEGDVFILSRKGGQARVSRIPELACWFTINRQTPESFIFHFTYRQLYSHYLRCGIVGHVQSRAKTKAVTHYPRHQYAKKVLTLAHGNQHAVANALGHRSLTSQQPYIRGGKDVCNP